MLSRRFWLGRRFLSQQHHILSSPFGQVDIPELSLDQMVWADMTKWENKTAIECGVTGKRLSYGELRKRCQRLATSLAQLRGSDCRGGGERALVVLPNCPEYPIALLGAIQAGLVPTLANPLYTSESHQDTLPAVLPFFHSYGAVVVLLRGLSKGVKLVTLPKFEPAAFLRILRQNHDIVLNAVPPIIQFLGSGTEVRERDLAGLRYTLTGAAPCSSHDLDRLTMKKPHTVHQAYGLTEASPCLTFPRKTETNKTTVGSPLPNTAALVVDPSGGKSLPPGEQGELWFKGPQVMEGYHKNPQATAETVDQDGWLHTGDIGYTDQHGNLYIVDRIKELIKVKGYQVAPAELEALLRRHPSVQDVGVTSAESVRYGELPVAFLVPRPGHRIRPAHLSEWLEKQVAPYKRIAEMIEIKEIPKSASGKILRRKLKDLARNTIKLD